VRIRFENIRYNPYFYQYLNTLNVLFGVKSPFQTALVKMKFSVLTVVCSIECYFKHSVLHIHKSIKYI
jgi:hypothetical protein